MFDPNRPSWARIATIWSLGLTFVALVPCQVEGQLEVALFLSGGIYDAAGDLPAAPILASEGTIVSFGELGSSPVLAGGLEIRATGAPLTLRLSAQRSLYRNETAQWGCAPDPAGEPVACPSILGLFETEIAMTAATADLVLDVPLGRVEVRPLVGAGWIRHSYRWDQPSVGAFSLAPGSFDANAPALHAGIGFSAPIRAVRVTVEYAELYARSAASRPSRTGAGTLGIVVPLR